MLSLGLKNKLVKLSLFYFLCLIIYASAIPMRPEPRFLRPKRSVVPQSTECKKDIFIDIRGKQSAIIESPSFGVGRDYPKQVTCKWEILVHKNERVYFKFIDFELENSLNCEFDFVAVGDLAKFQDKEYKPDHLCGYSAPFSDLTTEGPCLSLKFHSDSYKERRGFQAMVRAVPANGTDAVNAHLYNLCKERLQNAQIEIPDVEVQETSPAPTPGETVEPNTNSRASFSSKVIKVNARPEWGNIYTDGFENGFNYPAMTKTTWQISADTNKKIELFFPVSVIEIAERGQCIYDNLKLYDGGDPDENNLLGKFCGKSVPKNVTSSSNKFTILFSSDEYVEDRGVHIMFREAPGESVKKTESPEKCNSEPVNLESTDTIKHLYSPGFHKLKEYKNKQDCTWVISSKQYIKLEVKILSIEQATECKYDNLKIYDGLDKNAALLTVMCGEDPPKEEIKSSGHFITVTFHADDASAGNGFAIEYSSVENRCTVSDFFCDDGSCVKLRNVCDGRKDCSDGKDEERCNFEAPKCGSPYIKPAGYRIVGGEDALRHSMPWIVALVLSNGRTQFCGGSLINNEWILTAAHCVVTKQTNSVDKIKAFLGKQSLATTEVGEVYSSISQIIVHKGYNHRNMVNDIALLKLSTPVKFSTTILPICLPEETFTFPSGEKLMAAGWGITEHGRQSIRLKQVQVPYVGHALCSSSGWYGSLIKTSMLCAGYTAGAKDSCQGDSGGPLIYFTNNKFYLVGATSWGRGCASARRPGVYSKISAFRNWVKEETRKNSATGVGI